MLWGWGGKAGPLPYCPPSLAWLVDQVPAPWGEAGYARWMDSPHPEDTGL